MLKIYFDESGHTQAEKVCVVAGFVGSEAQWQGFDITWREGLGRRKHLHMVELRWKYEHLVRPLLARLGPIPYKHGLMPIACKVEHADYSAIVKPYSSHSVFSPWQLAVQGCVIKLLGWLPSDEVVAPIFENQDKYRDDVMFLYDATFRKGRGDRRFLEPKFVPKTATVRLEAADYFAYAFRLKYLDEWAERFNLCAPILGDKNTEMLACTYGPDAMRQYVKQLKRVVSERGPSR